MTLSGGEIFIYVEPDVYGALRDYARKIGFPGEESK